MRCGHPVPLGMVMSCTQFMYFAYVLIRCKRDHCCVEETLCNDVDGSDGTLDPKMSL
jgi:hypothetical protein